MACLQGRRVLIIEDEAMIAMMLEDALRDAGAEVLGTAASLAEADRHLAASTPDLALLDLQLGLEDAMPLAHRLQARGIPFVICTGFGEPSLAPGLAPQLVLTKPVDMAELMASLATLCG